jgi:hypothetical protein
MAIPNSGTLGLRAMGAEKANDSYDHPLDATGLIQLSTVTLKDFTQGGNTNGSSGSLIPSGFDANNTNYRTSLGTVTTSAATNVSNNQFTMNGNVSSFGALINTLTPFTMSEYYDYDHDIAAVTKGFVYSSSNSTPTVGGSGSTSRTVSGTSTGAYSYTQSSGILSNTTYYTRAWVKNENMGIAYGSVVSLTTSSGTSLSSYTLKYDFSKFAESSICSSSNTVTVYSSESSSNAIFTNAATIYANSSGGTEATSGWYSNGNYKAKWSNPGAGGTWTISYSLCGSP